MVRRFGVMFLTMLALLSTGADCGHGGGPTCPERPSAAEGPDAGSWPEEDFPDDPADQGNAEINTGGSTGGGGPDDCRRQ